MRLPTGTRVDRVVAPVSFSSFPACCVCAFRDTASLLFHDFRDTASGSTREAPIAQP